MGSFLGSLALGVMLLKHMAVAAHALKERVEQQALEAEARWDAALSKYPDLIDARELDAQA